MPETPEQIAGKLSPEQCKVIDRMSGDWIHPASHVAADVELPVREVRKIMRGFRADGLADLSPCFNEDTGLISGRGYWLTNHGLAVRNAQTKDQAHD